MWFRCGTLIAFVSIRMNQPHNKPEPRMLNTADEPCIRWVMLNAPRRYFSAESYKESYHAWFEYLTDASGEAEHDKCVMATVEEWASGLGLGLVSVLNNVHWGRKKSLTLTLTLTATLIATLTICKPDYLQA